MAALTPAPAPWHLTGNGLIALFYFSPSFLEQHGFLAAYQQDKLRWRIGAMMLMDYHSSKVGPYQELLFIPGLFNFQGRRGFSISKIYVSTQESQWNGRQNWGIPKELAHFEQKKLPSGQTQWRVSQGDSLFFEASFKARSFSFPFSSKLVPWSNIVQQHEHQLLQTAPTASGRLQPASLQEVRSNPAFFPPLQEARFLSAFEFRNFQLKFPVPYYLPYLLQIRS